MLKQTGVSLIELMIGLAVLGIVLAIAVPNLTAWMQNAQVRTAAESILSGIRVAREEAVRRNYQATFYLLSSSGIGDWCVDTTDVVNAANVDCHGNAATAIKTVQSWKGAQTKNARVGASTAATQNYATALAAGAGLPAQVTFNSLGRVVGAGITRIDVTSAAGSGARTLVIVISPYGLARLCDPSLSLAANPQGCA
ncbi:MAG: GspH/FimT family pseudopilin [Burkholderiales bacterium]|nr:GspH/FimT family pseudopilin [Burkholderiales bacterium]